MALVIQDQPVYVCDNCGHQPGWIPMRADGITLEGSAFMSVFKHGDDHLCARCHIVKTANTHGESEHVKSWLEGQRYIKPHWIPRSLVWTARCRECEGHVAIVYLVDNLCPQCRGDE